MKRRLFKLVVFLFLGAVVNVAVAWGSALWVDRGQSKIATVQTPQGYTWLVRSGSARGAEFVLFWRLLGHFDLPLPGEGNWPPDLIPSWSTISHEIDPAGPKIYGFQIQMQDIRGPTSHRNTIHAKPTPRTSPAIPPHNSHFSVCARTGVQARSKASGNWNTNMPIVTMMGEIGSRTMM